MEIFDSVFLFLKALTWRGTLSLLDIDTHPRYTLPFSFIATIRSSKVLELDEIVQNVAEQVADRLSREVQRSERDSLRPRQKQAWSRTKTRCPVRHHVDRFVEEVPFTNIMALALKTASLVAERLGPPWTIQPEGRRGRPPNYDPTLLAAALIVKHRAESCFGLGFGGLAKKLRAIEFDARLEGRGGPPTPSVGTLYIAFCKTPVRWLDEAVAQLDRLAAEEYAQRFGSDGLSLFALDSTGLRLQSLVVVERVFEKVVAHETLYVAAASRLLTNTIVAVTTGREAMRDAKPFIPLLPSGSILVVDQEFDAELNYELAAERDIKLICKAVKHSEKVGGRFRRRAAEDFDCEAYKTRKLVERVFGNASSRRVMPLTYRLPESRERAVRLVAAGHNLRCVLTVRALTSLFRLP